MIWEHIFGTDKAKLFQVAKFENVNTTGFKHYFLLIVDTICFLRRCRTLLFAGQTEGFQICPSVEKCKNLLATVLVLLLQDRAAGAGAAVAVELAVGLTSR